MFKLPFKVTKDTQLQWFQFKIINRIIGTKHLCKKMKIVPSDMCTFCNEQTETTHTYFMNVMYLNSFEII